VGLSTKTGIDLQREANGQLSLRARLQSRLARRNNVAFADGMPERVVGCHPGGLPLAAARWASGRHLKIPLACFGRAGADLGRVTTPFAIQTSGQLALSVANIRLESGMDGVTPAPAP